MTVRFALLIDPTDPDDVRTDFADTFREVDPAAPVLSMGELSAQRGDGVFETVGVIDGHPQETAAHLDRLAHSVALCDLPVPHLGQWRQAVNRAAAQCGPGEGAIKLILSRGVEHGPAPTAWVTASAAPDHSATRVHGVRTVTLDRGMDSTASARAPWLLLGAKTLSYAVNMAALREAHRRGADDAIFVSTDGVVLEGPTSSVILRFGDRFVTPQVGAGILHGTTQMSLFDHLHAQGREAVYETVDLDRLPEADAAWLVSSVRLAVPVTAIDEWRLPVDEALSADFTRYLLGPRD